MKIIHTIGVGKGFELKREQISGDGPLAFTGGGTAGHVFPALAILEELRRRKPARTIWIGSAQGLEKSIVESRGLPFYSIPAGKLRRYFSPRNLVDLFRVLAGFLASLRILLREHPVLLFSKGGYVSVPPVLAAAALKIPVITHESDLSPGLATRINARFAQSILVSFDESRAFFPAPYQGKVLHLGNPVRPELFAGDPSKGRGLVGCPPELPLILVLGGSLGSSFINTLIASCLDELTRLAFVVHQTGPAADPSMSRRTFGIPASGPAADSSMSRRTFGIPASGPTPEERRQRYHPASFFSEELPHLLAAADLVICRAGANTLWELAALGKAAILIPLGRSASRGDQIENAAYFARRGAARLLPEERAEAAGLIEIVRDLFDNREKLERMRFGAKKLALADSAAKIADLLWERSRGNPVWP